MTLMSNVAGAVRSLATLTRAKGDPRIVQSGPSSLDASDRLAKGLGWFSIGLGVVELFAPRVVTRPLGLNGSEGLVRLYGLREIGSGMLSLSPDKPVGLWSRVAGDALDIATVMLAFRPASGKRTNAEFAVLALAGVLLVDLAAATAASAARARPGRPRDVGKSGTRDLSGFPQGVAKARGAARDAITPPDMRAAPALAAPEPANADDSADVAKRAGGQRREAKAKA